MIKYLESDFASEIKNKRILVDFYADWCGPCRMMGEVLDKFDKIDILKVNVDKFQDIARQFSIMSIPTLILFDNGKVLKSHTGFINNSELEEFIK